MSCLQIGRVSVHMQGGTPHGWGWAQSYLSTESGSKLMVQSIIVTWLEVRSSRHQFFPISLARTQPHDPTRLQGRLGNVVFSHPPGEWVSKGYWTPSYPLILHLQVNPTQQRQSHKAILHSGTHMYIHILHGKTVFIPDWTLVMENAESSSHQSNIFTSLWHIFIELLT